jgi:hypothetical protein
MKEQLVEFKTAKLAKEKGFNVEYTAGQMFYITDEKDINYIKDKPRRTPFEHHTYILSPSQSLLQKWLREVHNIDVWAVPFKNIDDKKVYDWVSDEEIYSKTEIGYDTHEEALEKGLYEALKLIKK